MQMLQNGRYDAICSGSLMTVACDFSIMLWNGKSKGTYANIKELEDKCKKIILIICSPRN